VEKRSVAIVLQRARPLCDRLEEVSNSSAVESGFTAEQARLAHVVVVSDLAQEICTTTGTDQGLDRVVRDVLTAFQLIGLVGNLLTNPAVATDE